MTRWMKRRIERSRARCHKSEEDKAPKESHQQERFRKDVGSERKARRLTQVAGATMLLSR